MTLDEKREIISRNKDPAIAALQAVIDSYSELLVPVSDNSFKPIVKKFKEEKHFQMAKNIRQDIITYENILLNLKKDIALSEKEIAYIGIAFTFCSIRAKKKIEQMKKAKNLCDELANQLYQKID